VLGLWPAPISINLNNGGDGERGNIAIDVKIREIALK
jgi:hypothetical protein